MIQINNLGKVYSTGRSSTRALGGVNLNIPKGSVYGIIGLSGAGKSTLVRCLNLLEKPTEGQILVNGQDLTSLSGTDLRIARRKIGMIFQHFNLLASRTVAENIAFPLEIDGMKRAAIKERVSELLPLVGLTEKADSYPSELSGGQKQRVGIARALALKPDVLLCDEATSALDPQTTLSILSLLKDINRELGLTIVIITHEMKVIKEICTHVAVLHDSRCVEDASVEEVFTAPKSETAKDFVASVFPAELPEELLKELSAHADAELVRINFLGDAASKPVINGLVTECGVQINILYGSIEHLRSSLFGNLILEIRGTAEQRARAHEYLKRNNLTFSYLSRGGADA
ncbi:ATP-binding cassette domain-containing protein [Geovibrio thiophilus]|uniref:Cell division ATP-binding protein FtsE n=1 Tax=Geovibrio thiophilus TaxID=139438 RepID=A0A410JZI8_9BACT|nr:ATP-binding cassette domain-containing protein [Geovibrio thiophilus]QAR33485.1 ATP-binding cassette domain-containing protein [Geovibrio thiophilus]